MALFHMRVKAISRGQGKNIIKSASYRSGERLYDEQNQTLTKQYARKERVEHTEIVMPENAPAEFSDRATLWNAVNKSEKRKDSQLAREIEFSIPRELPPAEQIKFSRDFVKRNFVKNGMIADFAVHNNEGNPHCHVLLTTREVTPEGFGKKNREWNDKAFYETVRKDYETAQNKALERVGSQERVSRLSYAARGINKIPTVHEGWRKDNKEKRQLINEEIKAKNQEIKRVETSISDLKNLTRRAVYPSDERQNTTQEPQKAQETALDVQQDRNTPEQSKAVRELFWGADNEEKELLEKMAKKYKTKGKLSPSDIADIKIFFRNNGATPEQNAQTLAKYGFKDSTIQIITKVKPGKNESRQNARTKTRTRELVR